MHQAGFGVGGGHEARPGEMSFRAQQSGSGEDHRSRLDPWGETREPVESCVFKCSHLCIFTGRLAVMRMFSIAVPLESMESGLGSVPLF